MCGLRLALLGILTLAGPAGASVDQAAGGAATLDFSAFGEIPIQSRGRIAPLDTVARRAVGEVTGRSTYAGRSAVEVVLSWTLLPDEWPDLPVIKVEHEPLKLACGLEVERRHFSLRELAACGALSELVAAAERTESNGLKPTALQRQAMEISGRMWTMQSFLYGQALTLVPSGRSDKGWSAIGAAGGGQGTVELRRAWASLAAAYSAHDSKGFADASRRLADGLRAIGDANYPTRRAMALEATYNRLHPFRWAWVTMMLAMLCGLTGVYLQRRGWDVVTAFVTAAACVVFLAGFALRWSIAGRAPLSNMYESMTVLAGSVAIFGLVFFLVMRQRVVAVVAAGLSAAGLVLADVLPIESAVTTLPPVLRNTVWLTIHVATIVLGYGAAALSMGVAHVQLGLMALAPRRVAQARETARLNYFVILVAIIFLTAGIIFGAVWANASWGRYWGWDPKETWSLITLFGYLALLHARYTGWLRDFGMAIASIGCFQLVLMTYYGVNYVLGTGLHSYGFGAGGLQWIILYLGLEMLICVAAILRFRARRSRGDEKASPLALKAPGIISAT